MENLSKLNRLALKLAAYASQGGSPHHHAKARFQVLVALSWAGLVTRRVSTKGFEVFLTSQPPFPSFAWRNPLIFPGDYISLTDMAKRFEGGGALIEQWLKNKDTVLFLGV